MQSFTAVSHCDLKKGDLDDRNGLMVRFSLFL